MPTSQKTRRPKVLAISSGGGHWIQLLRLRPAFEGAEVHFACSDPGAAEMVGPAPFSSFPDANKDQPLKLLFCAFAVLRILLRTRPDAIVTTGAAGGYLAIALGRLFGIRGMFVDSIANAHELSISARLALRITDKVLTQWPGVADATPAAFHGRVL
ncbi:hypothetical protein [Aliiruegeria sabulilitoris]|uniref:hypothetical protein n=1 Tax=Aliiruegeria sabulilitoris TaxID=1510458 RepID=UPI0008377879|nr:hypothetical protein [Aliiruegeria sabulilitoris]NDR56287.1 UDP-N-acetylglucosamine--LPS N-acetylglucosamine transferase [Pseudoruegeria sp. M32A2M]